MKGGAKNENNNGGTQLRSYIEEEINSNWAHNML